MTMWPREGHLLFVAALFAGAVAIVPSKQTGAGADPCLAKLDAWCSDASECPGVEKKGSCGHGQHFFALLGLGKEGPPGGKQWRCYAASSLNGDHTAYTGGSCYCTRPQLAGMLCECDASRCPSPSPSPPPLPPPTPAPTPAGAKNVLFIAVDDLRPMMHHAYNFTIAHTPRLDLLASGGVTFVRAYANYAFCSPSRNSFMSGRLPDTTKVWEFKDSFRNQGDGNEWTTLPGYFKQHGYLTLGSGKLFHPSGYGGDNAGLPANDYPRSWSPEYPYFANQLPGCQTCPVDPFTCAEPKGATDKGGQWCAANVDKDASTLLDQKIRDSCIEHLRIAANESSRPGSAYYGKPFFVGCGLHKPHVPWQFPAEFWSESLFPPASDIPLAPPGLQYAPQGMPMVAWHPPSNVDFTTPFNVTVDDATARLYRRAYYASVAYQDYNIGMVLDALDDLNKTSSTLCIFFGDHGWHLGEQDTWAKMTNFERAVHVPLIIRAPWAQAAAGSQADVFAELVDLYATAADLAGLPPPHSVGEMINGTSLGPWVRQAATPSVSQGRAAQKDAAFSQFAKACPGYKSPSSCVLANDTYVGDQFVRSQTALMGYSVRTALWRYTVWFPFDAAQIKPVLGPDTELGRELYNHSGDTGLWLDYPGEQINLADRAEHREVVQALHERVLNHITL